MWTGLINSRLAMRRAHTHTHTHTLQTGTDICCTLLILSSAPTWFYAHTESFVVTLGLIAVCGSADSRVWVWIGVRVRFSVIPVSFAMPLHTSVFASPGARFCSSVSAGKREVRGHTAPPQPSDVTSLWKWHGCRFWIRGLLMAAVASSLFKRQYF